MAEEDRKCLEAALARLAGAVRKRWPQGEAELEDAAVYASIATDVQDMHVEDVMDSDELAAYRLQGPLHHFIMYLDWDVNQEERVFEGFTYSEAVLGFAWRNLEAMRQWNSKEDDTLLSRDTILSFVALSSSAWEAIVLFDSLDTRAKALATLPSMGGRANADRFKPVRKKAIELYESQNWRSPRSAATAIWEEVYLFARQNGPPLSEDRAMTTVYGWLLKHTGAGARTRDQVPA